MIAALLALALAEDVRVGVFVGNDEGATGEERLLFAAADARKMRDLFVARGGLAEQDALLLLDRSRRELAEAMRQARLRVERAEADGADTTVILYYSGHGDDAGLHLGTSEVTHEELREWLALTGADVRVAILDACQSGAAVRRKGGTRGPSHTFAVDVERARGTAFLTSSAASEFSQESEEIGGGFFTHFLHAALSGAADLDLDGDVSLGEAYAFVHTETAFSTRAAPEQQTPGFEFDLSGTGEVWLTRLDPASGALSFPGGLSGTYAVWDESRRRYVGEVDGAAPATLAVAPGVYFVQRRQPAWVEQARYSVVRGAPAAVDAGDFEVIAYEEVASRGELERQARRARMPDLQLQALAGGRGFGNQSVMTRSYLPTHPVGGLGLRWLGRSGPYVATDLLSGGGPGTLSIGSLPRVAVIVQSASLGASAGFATRPGLARAGLGGRAELTWFRRDFPAGELPTQDLVRPAIGVETWAGLHYGRVHLDLDLRLLALPGSFDGLVSNPLFAELLLGAGYRF